MTQITTILTDQIERLLEHTATCDCGEDVELEVIRADPFRVVRKCDACGLTSLCYPFDQDGDLERLRQWTLKVRQEARQERADARRYRRAEDGHPDA